MNKNDNYLIPNVTNAANVGDEAMLEVLIDLIYKANSSAKIILHSVEPRSHKLPSQILIRPTLYYWAAFENTSFGVRVYRTSIVITALISHLLHLNFISKYIYKREEVIQNIFEDYENADKIVFVGGGYLRSKKGLTQNINLIFLLLPFLIAKTTPAKKIISPISIGPYAHKWHTDTTARIIKGFQMVGVRESFSYKLMEPYKIKNLYRGTDHALFLTKTTTKNAFNADEIKIGFTIRTWLSGQKQVELENSYISAIQDLNKKVNITIQPIVQVDAPAYGEGDAIPTDRVINNLKKAGIKVLDKITVNGVQHGKSVYANLDLLIGMRMHSNILAASQGTLFVPVSYEYKTEGIANDLGLENLCIKCSEITPKLLLERLEYALKNKEQLEQKCSENLKDIQNKEENIWLEVLSK